ncbi:MAG: hypothetical protein M1812_007127 [Candelaria pacifica]|nr:MAG: hypothetical protein M1812_007127 [Candelaria pacifica]
MVDGDSTLPSKNSKTSQKDDSTQLNTTNDTSLAGKTAIVTGGSRGIGAGIAYELARRGARVIIVYTSSSSSPLADELVSRIQNLSNGSSALAVRADLRSPDAPSEILKAASLDTYSADNDNKPSKTIDILVNNAGGEGMKPLADITASSFSSVYDINVRGPLFMTQAVLPHLRAPGRIINISSVGARLGFGAFSLYCSSKTALEGLTRCWAAELGKDGHTVNAVSPGPVETGMYKDVPSEIVEMHKKQTVVENRLGTVDDIAQVVAFLAEERSRWISGQVLSTSGGFNMY